MKMNMTNAFEGIQRAITLLRVDVFQKFLFVTEQRITEVLDIKFWVMQVRWGQPSFF